MNDDQKLSLLKVVLSQQSHSGETKPFRNWIKNYITLNIKGARIKVNNGNMYVVKGKADVYPCIVSHTDTVHKINRNVQVHQQDDILFAYCSNSNRTYGIGGDDKVGVFVCLLMLHELDNVKCAFFRDEEVGCVGSELAVTSWFDDCAFVLQCDRRGNKDFISDINGLTMYGKEFSDAIADSLKRYGYREWDGMMTDVEQLKKSGVDICMANMSCGYYEPHSDKEYVVISEVFNCADLVLELCEFFGYTIWKHKGEYQSYTGWSSGTYYSGDYVDSKIYTSYNENGLNWKDKVWHNPTKENHGFYYMKELSDLFRGGTTEQYVIDKGGELFAGDGTWQSPYRWKDKLIIKSVPFDEPWDKKPKQPARIKHGCPICGVHSEMMYDKNEEDYFCFGCSSYEKQAQRMMDDYNEQQKFKQDQADYAS